MHSGLMVVWWLRCLGTFRPWGWGRTMNLNFKCNFAPLVRLVGADGVLKREKTGNGFRNLLPRPKLSQFDIWPWPDDLPFFLNSKWIQGLTEFTTGEGGERNSSEKKCDGRSMLHIIGVLFCIFFCIFFFFLMFSCVSIAIGLISRGETKGKVSIALLVNFVTRLRAFR